MRMIAELMCFQYVLVLSCVAVSRELMPHSLYHLANYKLKNSHLKM